MLARTVRRACTLAVSLLVACEPVTPRTLADAEISADAGAALDAPAAPPNDGSPSDSGPNHTGPNDGGPSHGGPTDAGAVGSCTRTGGAICGVDVGGDPGTVYTCDGAAYVPLEACADGCDRMPPGVPDRCRVALTASDLPAELVDALSATPYVEGDCVPVTHPGWPYEAARCAYSAGGLTTSVTVANPSARRVARWIVDASAVIPALSALRDTDRASWVAGLVVIATNVMNQSSRIFPLEGGIIENQGSGYIDYPFRMGVTDGCSTGCYCRINSIHRTELCSYRDALGLETEADCLARVGTRGLTDAWGATCQGNHERAFTSDTNDHFRARAWIAQQALASSCGRSCGASQVLSALRDAFPP